MGLSVAGAAGGGRPVRAGAGDHCQFPRPVRDTGLRDLGGIALAWRVLRHRLARRIRGNALYRTIHGAGAGRGAGHRTAAWTAGLRRARGGAGAALPAGRLRPRNPAAAAEAGRMDGTLPPLDGAADGVDRVGAGLARLADRRRAIPCARPRARRTGAVRAGAARPVPAPRERRGTCHLRRADRRGGAGHGLAAAAAGASHERAGEPARPGRIQRDCAGGSTRHGTSRVRLVYRGLVRHLQGQ